ncbi:hypothetical protein Amac_003730 [Acrocarpospora macrocephala]|uniref:Uncharacterized protein n=1 Tax=Acrocarpospora macrocephala TaxID=150177 RepID=A0A5M3WK51_9ACTN|nr:hypothetical protein Amac_003730 [Acrocarpospora macrocephala]
MLPPPITAIFMGSSFAFRFRYFFASQVDAGVAVYGAVDHVERAGRRYRIWGVRNRASVNRPPSGRKPSRS